MRKSREQAVHAVGTALQIGKLEVLALDRQFDHHHVLFLCPYHKELTRHDDFIRPVPAVRPVVSFCAPRRKPSSKGDRKQADRCSDADPQTTGRSFRPHIFAPRKRIMQLYGWMLPPD